MTILVTGVTGYIGREFIRLSPNIYNIIALIRNKSDDAELKVLKCKIIRFSAYRDLNAIFNQNQIVGVVHFASKVVVKHTDSDISKLIDSNITFGTKLLEASKNTDVKWFLNTGTFWQNYQNKEYSPVNLYASTKEAFEKIAKLYSEISNLTFTTIKLNDTFGPNDTRNKIFNLWADNLNNNETIDMSAGEQIIDISYIDDVINAYIVMIDNLSQNNISQYNNKTFVVTNSEKPTLKELSKIFEDITKSKLSINWGNRKYRDREVMLPYLNGNCVPNWKQQNSLKESIQKTIKSINNE